VVPWKKSGCLLVLLVHHGRHHQLRDGLRRTILSVSMHAIMLFFFCSLCASAIDGDLAMGLDVEGDETGSSTDTDSD